MGTRLLLNAASAKYDSRVSSFRRKERVQFDKVRAKRGVSLLRLH